MHETLQSLPLVPPAFRVAFYGMAGLALAIFTLGTLQRMALWRLGRPRPDRFLGEVSFARLLGMSFSKAFSADCLLARRSFGRSRYRGFMLICLIWGGMGILIGILLSALGYLWPGFFASPGVRQVLALAMDLAGGLLLLGLLLAVARRYIFRPERWLDLPGDGFTLGLLLLVVGLGFAMEGVRLAGLGSAAYRTWPVGAAFGSALLLLVGGDASRLTPLYGLLYLLHAGASFGLLAYVPYSRLFHVFAAQITTFAQRRDVEQLTRRMRPAQETEGARQAETF